MGFDNFLSTALTIALVLVALTTMSGLINKVMSMSIFDKFMDARSLDPSTVAYIVNGIQDFAKKYEGKQ